MKKKLSALLALTMLCSSACSTSSTSQSTTSNSNEEASETTAVKLPVVAEEDRPRAIITTDVECDDMNSLIHLSLYFNEVDVDGIVYSASKYHFNGDGEHTLGEVTPNYMCEGEAVYTTHTGSAGPDPEAKNLTHYRDIPENWIEDLWDNEYREAYEHLSKNDANYPTADELLEITKVGNIAFEGDVREDTEGSNLIKEAILDDDERKLYVFSWGGVNTVVRALMSIYEEYSDTDDWKDIQEKVVNKVIISGNGQDNSWTDNKVEEMFPGIVTMSTSGGYAAYFAPLCTTDDHDPSDLTYYMGTDPDVNYTFQADWLSENIKFDHGSLMSKYNLMGDGTEYENEVDAYQYGLNPTIDWGYDGWEPKTFNQYDFLAEGDSSGFMALLNNGLKGMENGRYGSWAGIITYSNEKDTTVPTDYDYTGGTEGNSNRFLLPYQLDWAARADWCVKNYDECNHAPQVSVEEFEITAEAGKPVNIKGIAVDPDGDNLNSSWFFYKEGSQYDGTASDIRVWTPEKLETGFTIPNDAKSGDWFNLVLEVSDDAEASMTRYAQVIVRVK